MRSKIYPSIDRTQNSDYIDCVGSVCERKPAQARRRMHGRVRGEFGVPTTDSLSVDSCLTLENENFSQILGISTPKNRVSRPQPKHFTVFTDGSSTTRGRRTGGAAYIILDEKGKPIMENAKGFTGTTNNRMEMLAIISAVNRLPKGSRITVNTDSRYCIQMFTAKKVSLFAKNTDLIDLFRKVADGKNILFNWIKGHNGNYWNERADRLAVAAHADIASI